MPHKVGKCSLSMIIIVVMVPEKCCCYMAECLCTGWSEGSAASAWSFSCSSGLFPATFSEQQTGNCAYRPQSQTKPSHIPLDLKESKTYGQRRAVWKPKGLQIICLKMTWRSNGGKIVNCAVLTYCDWRVRQNRVKRSPQNNISNWSSFLKHRAV